jgi:CRISPR-associated protein Csd1
LIEGEDTHITVGPLVYVFWTREEQPFSIASLLSRAEPDEVRTLLNSAIAAKQSATHIKPSAFFATAFSASGGRVVVRDWLETTVEKAKTNLARWFALQAIIGEWGKSDAPFFPIQGYLRRDSKQWVEGLSECVVPRVRQRRDIQDVNPNVPRALIHLALAGGPLPRWLLAKAVTRNVCEQGVTQSRAALIKMVLLSSNRDSVVEGSMEKLDPANNDSAYLCGRLLAVLEAIQREAMPGVKATITDRFFGTASSAPASVFGRLIRGSQPHLAKLRKDRRAASEALQKRLEEIIHANLRTFPRVLTLEQQGIFAIGYYHQRAEDRAAAMALKHGKL